MLWWCILEWRYTDIVIHIGNVSKVPKPYMSVFHDHLPLSAHTYGERCGRIVNSVTQEVLGRVDGFDQDK
jgi:hypothetical protein